MFSVFQVKISFFSVLAVLFFQHCLLGQSLYTIPQDYGDAYRTMVDEYKFITKKHTGILNAEMANDPTFRRAKNWLENEQSESNFLAVQEQRGELFADLNEEGMEFLANLNEEDERRYRDWQLGVEAKVRLEVLKNEWNKYSASHKALLFYAASSIIGNRRLSEADEALSLWARDVMNQIGLLSENSKVDSSDLSLVRGLYDDSQWQRFVNYTRDSSADLVELIPLLTRRLGVKPEMSRNFETMVAKSTLGRVYSNYYSLCCPPELEDIERQQQSLSDRLVRINPNWRHDEGIESFNPFALIALDSPISWIWMGLGVMIVYVLIRVCQHVYQHQQRNKKDSVP